MYLVWLIILFGAEVAHACSAHYDRRPGAKIDGFTQSFRWLGHLWVAQQKGESRSLPELVRLDPYNYQVPPDEQLSVLLERQLIKSTVNGNYILSRDLASMTLNELYRCLPWQLPEAKWLKGRESAWEEALAKVIEEVEACSAAPMGQSVAELYT